MAGQRLPMNAGFVVIERLVWGTTIDFEAPQSNAGFHRVPLTNNTVARLTDLLGAAWNALDAVAANPSSALQKGPREEDETEPTSSATSTSPNREAARPLENIKLAG